MAWEDIYGEHDYEGNVYVNLLNIWNDSCDEKSFIKNLSKVLHHEYLHVAIMDVANVPCSDFEEELVRKITGTKHDFKK